MALRVSIFTNAGTVPLEIATRLGYFADAGVEVTVTGTTSSIEQMTGVIDGRYDIAASAIDNIIAYNAGQGAAPTERPSQLKVFMGSASYRLPLVAAPDVAGFADLRGKVIAVDALTTGFAFLLREILHINDLAPGDYDLVSTGAPKERWQAVEAGNASAALLNAHFEAIAHGQGCHTLTSDPDPWDGYQGNVFCAGPEVLASDALEAFRTATLRAVDFVRSPENKAEVADALVHHLGGMDRTRALDVAASLAGPSSVLKTGLPISRSGTETVMRLRETYTSTGLGIDVNDLFDPRALLTA